LLSLPFSSTTILTRNVFTKPSAKTISEQPEYDPSLPASATQHSDHLAFYTGRQDHGSAGPTGAAYRDAAGWYVSDSATTTQGKASDTAEAVKDTAARATQTVADTARAAGEKASQAATATKDAAVDVRSFALDPP
jgi:hypothetical protein